MNAHDYDAGFNAGYRKAQILQHRYAWTKLFCLVFLATFFAFASVAALATLL
jgi:hypothetical protein